MTSLWNKHIHEIKHRDFESHEHNHEVTHHPTERVLTLNRQPPPYLTYPLPNAANPLADALRQARSVGRGRAAGQ